MATRKTGPASKKAAAATKKRAGKSAAAYKTSSAGSRRYCQLPEMPEREFSAGIDPNRMQLVRQMAQKWANGTRLHYYFFDQQADGEHVVLRDGSRRWVSWIGSQRQADTVREAFDTWKQVGIGLEFEEVSKREDAEIRIGFMDGDGAWSYLGRAILTIGVNKRTMNFGWDISRDPDTALHEIGHTLGFPHEHQNPNAGIDWDEDAVYRALAGPPNNWSRQKTHHNILRKIPGDTVQGSSWDPNSIMHYPFEAPMIEGPDPYDRTGISPAGGLSARDVAWVQEFYPPLQPQNDATLQPFDSVELHLGEGEQENFVIEPDATRYYNIRTFGASDTVMVLFEDDGGDLRYLSADDDSGNDLNASIRIRLFSGRRYILRIRLYWSDATGRTAVMLW